MALRMPSPAVDIPAWFAGKSIEELGAIEVAGRVHIPDALVKIGPKGEEQREPVMLRLPTDLERALAQRDALHLVGKLHRKAMGPPEDWTVQRAKNVIGDDLWENFDTLAILAVSTREAKPDESGAYQQAWLLELLMEAYPTRVLFALYERLDFYAKLYDPRLEVLDEAQFWTAVEAIARKRTLSPLVVMGGALERGFIVSMAEALWSSRAPSSSSPSTATSTRDF